MTFLLILAVPLLLLALAALVGLRLPKTHAAASRIRLNQPVAAVWDAIVDRQQQPSWRPGLAAVEPAPPINGRPSWYEVCARNIKVQFAEIACEPPKRLVTALVGENLPLYGAWTFELAADDGGTLLTITESDNIYHPLLRFFSRFVISYHGAMDVFLISLALKFGETAHPEHLSLKQDNRQGE